MAVQTRAAATRFIAAQNHYSQATRRRNRYVLDHFAELAPRLDTARPAQIRRFLDQGHAPSTQRVHLSILRNFFRWAVNNRLTNKNPTNEIRLPTEPKRVPRGLTRNEARRLVEACPDSRARCLVLFGFQLGLRRAELAAIDLHHINWDAPELLVKGKYRKERVLPLPQEAAMSLDRYLSDHPASDGPLFRSYTTGRRLSAQTVGRLIVEWMTAAGLKSRPYDGRSAHAMRHTFAKDLMTASEGNIYVVGELLGHQSPQTTAIYTNGWKSQQTRQLMEGRTYV